MALSLQIQGEIILIWLLVLSAEVSSSRNECWSFLCVTDSNLNCICKPEIPSWLIPIVCLVPLLIIGTCCIRMCIYYYKKMNDICLPDGTSLPTPVLFPMSEVITELRILPSYNEAAAKEPSSLEELPAYEDIAL